MSLGGFEPPTFRSEAERSIQAELQAHSSIVTRKCFFKLSFAKRVFSKAEPLKFFVRRFFCVVGF